MSTLLAVLRFLLFALGSAIAVPWAWVMRELRQGNVDSAKIFHKMACFVFGIKIRQFGTPYAGPGQVVFLSNHLSYLDIIVLGSQLQARFVAKAEVAHWPVFGTFARTQRTIFIERTRAALEGAKNIIATALREGNNIILFGEGTSTDGRNVLPFKAGLLEMLMVEGVNAQLQPIAIVIESAGGQKPNDQAVRDLYAWYRPESTLAPHLWTFAKAGGAVIQVHYLPVLDPAKFPDRKSLAQAATQSVASVL